MRKLEIRLIVAERTCARAAEGTGSSVGDHDDIEGFSFLSALHSDALLGRTLSDFAAIAFKAFEDTSQHVEAIRSFICGRSF